MSLRINQNVTSLSTYANLNSTSNRMEKSIGKLSSGLRINSAADDAAGLAISEKMRSQISGLNRARLNAQDGISMIQTAEGGLNETESIIQRMRELAIQGSNDTLTSNDRLEIQKEINQTQEFVRISELCFVYAKAKWMRTFKAFDLDGFFPGKLIYASMIRDNDENREKLQQLADHNAYACLQLQLRKGDNVVFETRLTA